MNEEDIYEDADLPEIDEDWVKDIRRISELKEQKRLIEEEIAHINATAAEAQLRGYFTDLDGQDYKVTVRQDKNTPRITDPKALQENHPALWMEIASVQVDSNKLKAAMKKGYFTNTTAAQYLSQTYKQPWLQITQIAKEMTDTNE